MEFFSILPKRGQRYKHTIVLDPVPLDTKIANLYDVNHIVLNRNSSECWRERIHAEVTGGSTTLESDAKLAAQQRRDDRQRMSPPPRSQSCNSTIRKEKGMPPVYREKPLEPYRHNALRSIPARKFNGERNFKKVPNYRNVSHFTFSGMDGHSFVNNPRLRYSTTSVLAHSNEAVEKIATENPSITSQLVKLIHKKAFK